MQNAQAYIHGIEIKVFFESAIFFIFAENQNLKNISSSNPQNSKSSIGYHLIKTLIFPFSIRSVRKKKLREKFSSAKIQRFATVSPKRAALFPTAKINELFQIISKKFIIQQNILNENGIAIFTPKRGSGLRFCL